ncbi:MAG: hypothetical protein ACI399_02210 [Candidatus Cryptobacteroides sp.]
MPLLFRRTSRMMAPLLAVLLMLSSCSKADDIQMESAVSRYNMLVTVRTSDDGSAYFCLDDETTLEPVGWTNIFGKETRAILYGVLLDEPSETCTRKVMVREITEVPSFNTVSVVNPREVFFSANSPVIVYDDWLTCCEDGYLTLHLSAQCTSATSEESFSLLGDPDNPGCFYLMRDKDGSGTKIWRDFIVAFCLEGHLTGLEPPQAEIFVNNYSYYGFVRIPFTCLVR